MEQNALHPSSRSFCHDQTKHTHQKHFAQQKITITRFHDRKVCPYITLCHYIDRTATLRDSNKLFITTTTYTAAAAGTISRWVKCLMEKSGVDVSKFTPHTTRAASVSKHAQFSKSLTDILKLGHWRSTSSFFRHYLRTPENTNIKSPTPTKPLTCVATRKTANFKLKNALKKARFQNRRFSSPCSAPFTDSRLPKEHEVTILDVQQVSPQTSPDNPEVVSVIPPSEIDSHLTDVDLIMVDNQLKQNCGPPTPSELSASKVAALNNEFQRKECQNQKIDTVPPNHP